MYEQMQDIQIHLIRTVAAGAICFYQTHHAFSRIYELLPPKIQQWQSSPCVTEENNKKTLEKIRRQQLETRQKLAELDYKHQELDAVIERAKQTTISHDQDVSSL